MQDTDSTEAIVLCTTCNHSQTCAFPHRADRPVMFCEEFDGYQDRPSVPTVRTSAAPHDATALTAEADRASKFKGLCMSCESRGRCTFPGAQNGARYCEEFA